MIMLLLCQLLAFLIGVEAVMGNVNILISDLLEKYNKALGDSDSAAVASLYADDGVVMPPFSSSAVGAVGVRKAYDSIFQAIELKITFPIAEIVEVSDGWAFARTNSVGTSMDRATGTVTAWGGQELFLFQKDRGGVWKIARYSFSPTSMPAGL